MVGSSSGGLFCSGGGDANTCPAACRNQRGAARCRHPAPAAAGRSKSAFRPAAPPSWPSRGGFTEPSGRMNVCRAAAAPEIHPQSERGGVVRDELPLYACPSPAS